MSPETPSDTEEPTRIGGRSPRKLEALELFRGLPRHYDVLSAGLSFGQDPRWRRTLVSAVAPVGGRRVLDVATGTGMVVAELLRSGDCSVVGVDQSSEMLSVARARFERSRTDGWRGARGPAGADRAAESAVELIEAQAESLPFPDESFDALTFTYLLRYVDDPRATVRELARVLRPGGRIASLEFGVPPGALARWAWRLYTAVGLPALGRMASREWGEVGRFLGPSIRGFYERHPVAALVEYWYEAGLRDIAVRRMSLGGGIIMSATKASTESATVVHGK